MGKLVYRPHGSMSSNHSSHYNFRNSTRAVVPYNSSQVKLPIKRKFKEENKTKRKTKFKKPQSYTKTLTQKSKERVNLQEISQHNDMSERRIPNVYPTGRFRMKSMGHFTYYDSHQTVQIGNMGDQYVFELKQLMSYSQLAGATTNNRASVTQWATDPMLLNPFSSMPGNAIYPAATYTANDKYAIKSVIAKYSIVSLEKIAQKVTFKLFMCKRNTTVGPITSWFDSMGAEGMNQAFAGQPGTTLVANPIPGQLRPNVVGMRPHQSAIFRKAWKEIANHTVILQPGDQRIIKTHININKSVTRQWLTDQSANPYIGGFTIVPMIIVHGALVGIQPLDIVGPPPVIYTESTEVTFGKTKLGIVNENFYTFFALPQNRLAVQRGQQGYIVNDTIEKTKETDDVDDVIDMGVDMLLGRA